MNQEELTKKISKLKKEKNGVLLGHNYQIESVQLVADFLGGSLALARKASETDADLVVFAGIDFMAETACILNPDKKVLIPDKEARCKMASMLPVEEVKRAKEEHPEAAVVLYVNTLAEARAEADVTCTSANAVQVVQALEEDKVLFGPDKNLSWYIKQNTDKEIITIPEDGHCYVHKKLTPEQVELMKAEYPDAEVLIHPESDPGVQKLADHICSTGQMMDQARESTSKKFIIGTEVGLVQRLERELPEKEFLPLHEGSICEEMKKHDLQKVYESFRDEKFEVNVPEASLRKARKATERMLKLSN